MSCSAKSVKSRRGLKRRAWGYKPALLLAAAGAAPAWGSDILWTNPAGGNFGTGGNWLGNTPPGGGDVADFSLANSYTVTFGGNANAAGLVAHGGTITLNLGGFAFSQSGVGIDPWVIGQLAGDNATISLSNGTVNTNAGGTFSTYLG